VSEIDPAPGDREARRRIREDLDTTLFVEAAAGTGKTTALVSRIVAVIARGEGTLERTVAVTFTEKAAGEMKLRLRAEIERSRAAEEPSGDVRRRLDAALEQLEVARIGTIHAFCGDLLRGRPVEAGVDPQFEIAAEDEAERMLDDVFDAWFQRILADPPEGVRRVLRRRPRERDASGPRTLLRRAVASLCEHRDFTDRWRRDPFDRDGAIDRLLEELAALGALAELGRPEDYLTQNLAAVARFVEDNRLLERVRGRDHDGLEAELRRLASRRAGWHWRGYGREHAPGLPKDEVLRRRDAVKDELDRLIEDADADLAACLQAELGPVVEAYERHKQRAGRLDFLDLLVRARDLVRGNDAVRHELQEHFSHFFVDEFQDTDPVQAELLLLLAADDPAERDWHRASPRPGKLFLVGDPKQAIYRFRRADVALYESIKRRLVERGADVVHLTTSFRAVRSLQLAVNAAFAPRMAGDAGDAQAGYVPLERWRPDDAGQPALVVLPAPRPYSEWGRLVSWSIEESLPPVVGAWVDWLIHHSGWTVEEAGRRVPVEPRHVCLMFRRLRSYDRDVTQPYLQALEARRIPHVLVGGYAFHEREEVLALRNALVAIEWPDDALRVFAALRGPFFALSDEALLAFRHATGSLNPLSRGEPGALDAAGREVAEALAILARLHARRNRRPIAATVLDLLAAVRAHAGIAIWPTGEQALANCLRVVDLARRFERGGAGSFRAFVERLEQAAERGNERSTPAVEEDTQAVRVMTAHAAKGLEFPVVVLCEPMCAATREPPMRHVDPPRGLWAEPLCGCAPRDLVEHREEEALRDREEALRVAYVAATRARDLLAVPAVGDEPVEGWIDVLNPVIYPAAERWRAAAAAAGCPAFGDETVLGRPDKARGRSSVRPGLHRPRAGEHEVVWWDPAQLDLTRTHDIGLRQEEILRADRDPPASTRSVHEHEQWQAARRKTIETASVPSLRVRTVTAAARAAPEPDGAGEVALESVAGDRAGRPHGVRFGTLVHATLAAVDLAAGADDVLAAATAQGRLLGATGEEVRAAAAAATAALRHPLLERARAAGARDELRRETPVLLRVEDGSLLEGVADLAFRETDEAGARWTVVDFKTDPEIAARRAEYERQVRLYVEAVAAATGEPARGVLLVV
jgi:ATP-dependent exoDNAse (exonuclease V) beta subunit